jgi:2-aminoadipate transaminase
MSDRINFARGVPAESTFPRAQIEACVEALVSRPDVAAFQYGPANGPSLLREWVAVNHGVDIDRVIAGDGSVGLFDILCRIWLTKRQTVLVEEPCYDRILRLLRYYGANVISFPMEIDGPRLEVLDAAAKRSPLFFYTVPDFQNPSGVTWSAEKRRYLVDLARQGNFTIVEDSPYRLLRYKGEQQPSFLEIGPDVTIQLNSFSKIIAPGLRAAYMIAPTKTVAVAAKMAENTYVTPGHFALSVAGEWLRRGYLPGQVATLRELYGRRAEAMVSALEEFMPSHRFARPEGGFFVGVTLSDALDPEQLRTQASVAGIDLSDGAGFFLNAQPTPFLRLPFCSTDEDTARHGVRTLATVIERCERLS